MRYPIGLGAFAITVRPPALPSSISSSEIGKKLEKDGVLTSYNSNYLLNKNWIQFCLVSEYHKLELLYAVIAFDYACGSD